MNGHLTSTVPSPSEAMVSIFTNNHADPASLASRKSGADLVRQADAPGLLYEDTVLRQRDHALNNTTTGSSIPRIELEIPSTAHTSQRIENESELVTPTTIASLKTNGFQGISLDMPSTGLSEEIGTKNMDFSQRGSMLLDGKRVNNEHKLFSAKLMPTVHEPVMPAKDTAVVSRGRSNTAVNGERAEARLMSTDEEQLSEKVRSFYTLGSDKIQQQAADTPSMRTDRSTLRWQDAETRDGDDHTTASRATSMTSASDMLQSPLFPKEDNELAGGMEDWQDVNNEEVDRYGFIIPKSPTDPAIKSQNGIKRTPTGSGPGLQRVSSSLQLASETPRRRHTIRRSPSNAHSSRSAKEVNRAPSISSISRPTSAKSEKLPRHHSTTRHLTNKLPQNRDRRAMDEAGDMLTLPRSRSNTATTLTRSMTESGTNSTNSSTYTSSGAGLSARRKETEREEKWRRMATSTPSKTGAVGGGAQFVFDTSSQKLIERTWKGIPDTWRATAWHCFLDESVKRHNKRHPQHPCLSDDELTNLFYEYQGQNSPDDVQIDIDVPRTISSHIMFRRRYRGGQRLLFRVLHALSLHFPEQGYVQGIAALAATLLAYYEETMAFVMLVRLWELRGLAKLYASGFGGLMEALEDFERDWLGQGELRKRLDALAVHPTAYGTKWYLTLFNYSIPFSSQLRVWDVFMLLGGSDSENDEVTTMQGSSNKIENGSAQQEKAVEKVKFGTTLDVLHATSAALIDGMRDILLESDFENAMKVLTSWVPIQDEDFFMRVAKAEYKLKESHRGKLKHR